MNKAKILSTIIASLKAAQALAFSAAETARETATHSENKAENRYDTLGLEAAYLAHGQSQRVLEVAASVEAFKNLDGNDQTAAEEIEMGSLITLRDQYDVRHNYFIGPTAGGLNVQVGSDKVMIITPSAPLGALLMGKYQYDEIELGTGANSRQYEIEAIL